MLQYLKSGSRSFTDFVGVDNLLYIDDKQKLSKMVYHWYCTMSATVICELFRYLKGTVPNLQKCFDFKKVC